jgi:hypothetical protein
MARSFTTTIVWEGRTLPVSLLTQQRQDGRYYEVNVPDVPRFRMRWSALGRYDIVEEDGIKVPYELILIIADKLGVK